jgi:ABC-type branched-subunit amino acid transport system substrate-binding protein
MSSPGGDVRTRFRRRRRRALAGAALSATLLAALLPGCGDDGPGDDDDPAGSQVRGVEGDTITLGAITVDSGPMAAAGRSVTAGNQAYFAALNDDGGVAGRYQVEIEVLDGADDAATVVRRYDESHEDVAMYVQALGFRAAGAILEPLMADDVLAATYALDFPWSRHQNLLAVGTPVTVGVHNALDRYVHEPGARRTVCALVDDGDYGAAAARAVRASATVLFLDVGPIATLPTADDGGPSAGVAAAVDGLARARCDVVVAATLSADSTAALARAAAVGFDTRWFVPAPGRPSLGDPAVAAYAAEQVRVVADDASWEGVDRPAEDGDDADEPDASGADEAEGPDEADRDAADEDDEAEGPDDLVAARDAHAPDVADGDPWFLLGYRQAMAAHQVLERAIDHGDLSQTGILLAANDTTRLDFAGLAADQRFGAPEYREPSRTSVLLRPGAPAGADDAAVVVGPDGPVEGQTAFEEAAQRPLTD